jgi:hypothetical protein
LTRRGDTTPEDTATQASRIAASVWQTLLNARQPRMPVRIAPVWMSSVGLTHPEQDHTDPSPAFHNAWAYDTAASYRARFVELVTEPAEASEDIDAVGESFRKLRESLSAARTVVFVAFTRATSETSTLVSERPAVHHGTAPGVTAGGEWTEEKNQRRCDLVDKEIDGTISAVEKVELAQLQAEMLAYRRKVAPLPLEELRKLHQELLRHASDKTPE